MWRSSHRGSAEINLTHMRTQVRSLAPFSGLSIQHCRELRCRSQMRLGSRAAVAVAQASGYSSNSTPSPGTSMCRKCGPKKTKKERERGAPAVAQRDGQHLHRRDAGLTPHSAQWLKDPVLPQPRRGADPRPRIYIHLGAAKTVKKHRPRGERGCGGAKPQILTLNLADANRGQATPGLARFC